MGIKRDELTDHAPNLQKNWICQFSADSVLGNVYMQCVCMFNSMGMSVMDIVGGNGRPYSKSAEKLDFQIFCRFGWGTVAPCMCVCMCFAGMTFALRVSRYWSLRDCKMAGMAEAAQICRKIGFSDFLQIGYRSVWPCTYHVQYIPMYVCTYVCMYLCVPMYVCTYVYLCMYVPMYVCTYVCMCRYVPIITMR